MQNMLNIPNYPSVCRVCLTTVDEAESITLDSEQSDALNYGDVVTQICSSHEEDGLSNVLPQRICLICQRRIDDLRTFQIETIANTQFLRAWIQFKYASNNTPLKELFQVDNKRVTIIRKTLRRINAAEWDDFSLVGLFTDTEDRVCPTESQNNILKQESKVDKSVTQDPLIISQIDLQHEDDDQSEDRHYSEDDNDLGSSNDPQEDYHCSDSEHMPKKVRRNFGPIQIIDGVRTRPCFFDNCVPIPVGQAEKHARENHRAYCKICGLVFPTQAQAIYHLAIHKPSERRFSCELCEKPFWREFDLKVHRREFHGKEMANLECPYCEQRFGRRAELIKHREIHKDCKFCSKHFKGYRFVLEHMREHHGERMLSCNLCSLLFLGHKEHQIHMEKHRDGVMENSIQFTITSWTGAQCITCDRSYYSPQYLAEHVTTDHKHGILEKPVKVMIYKKRTKEELDQLEFKFKCKDCDARFRLKTSLKGHWKKNHSGEQFICEHCGACFKSKSEMKLHERYLHTKDFRFACDFCDKRCNTRGDLAVHRRSHTNEKPYKCSRDGCNKAYKTHGALTKHVRLHTGEKPYKCSYEGCDKAYICSQLLKVHVRRHTLEKPFKCWYCEQYFNSTNNRRKHCRRHHVGLPIGRELEKLKQQEQTQNPENTCTEIKS